MTHDTSTITVTTQAALDQAIADRASRIRIDAPAGVVLTVRYDRYAQDTVCDVAAGHVVVDGGYVGSVVDGGYVGSVGAGGRVGSVVDGGRVDRVVDGGRVGSVGAGGRVGSVVDGGYVGSVGAGGRVGSVGAGGYVGSVVDGGRVGSVGAGGYVDRVVDGGYVGSVGAGGRVGSVGAGGYVGSVVDGGYVDRVVDGGYVDRAGGTAVVHLYHRGVIGRAGSHVTLYLHSATVTLEQPGGRIVDVSDVDLQDPAQWCDWHAVDVNDGQATLFKALDDDLRTEHPTPDGDVLRYVPGETVTAPDWSLVAQCGEGLHLSPSPSEATAYRAGATRWVAVAVDVESLVPIAGGTAKCKVESCQVVVEVDLTGAEVATVVTS